MKISHKKRNEITKTNETFMPSSQTKVLSTQTGDGKKQSTSYVSYRSVFISFLFFFFLFLNFEGMRVLKKKTRHCRIQL